MVNLDFHFKQYILKSVIVVNRANLTKLKLYVILLLKSQRQLLLTPKGPDCVFWQHSNFGQVPMTRDFHI